jgi:transposase
MSKDAERSKKPRGPYVRRQYTRQFKLEAVKLSEREGRTIQQAAEDLGIPYKLLYRWRYEHRAVGSNAFCGQGHRLRKQDELERLTRENQTLRSAIS